MDKLASIERLLEISTGSFTLSSSVDLMGVSFAASLFLDNTEDGLALVASGKGETSEEALESLFDELD